MAQLIHVPAALVSAKPILLTRNADSETNHQQEGQCAHSVEPWLPPRKIISKDDGGTTEEQVNA